MGPDIFFWAPLAGAEPPPIGKLAKACYQVPMDLFTIGYYGLICGLLAYVVPLLQAGLHRLLFGLTTGAIAATALPFVRDLISGGGY